jgi:phage terminase large subunit-like protein
MTDYGDKILSGEIDACEYVKLAVQRHVNDLARQRTPEFPYYFDEKAGEKVVKFLRLTRHYKGRWAGKKFEPADWQQWCNTVFYGWKRVSNDKRRFKYSYVEVPKKNGKSTWKAAECLYSLVADKENSPEIYTAASKEAQARIVLNDARQMAKKSPEILKRLKVYAYDIQKPDDGGVMKALGSDSAMQDGLNISRGQIDEYHAHKTEDMYDILKQGTGARDQAVIDIITTSGYDKSYPCYDFRLHCINVLKGILEQENLFTIIYTIDKDDDWKDPKSWVKANPNFDIINQEEYKEEAEMAQMLKSEEPKFKTKRLCLWTDAADVWVSDEDWMKCAGDEVDLTGWKCWGAVDLAATVDLNALGLLFEKEGNYCYKLYVWIPEKKVRERQDRVNYWKWKEENHIFVTPGDALDDEFMARDVMKILGEYDVQAVAIDRWYSTGIVGRMQKAGFPEDKMFFHGQGYKDMTGPVRELERMVNLKTLNHFGNPVLRWMCSNITTTSDAAGNIKFDKSKSSDKIDGMVTLAMAKGAEMNKEEEVEISGNLRIL